MLRTSAQTRHYISLGEIPRPRSRTRLQWFKEVPSGQALKMNTCDNSRQCLSAGLNTFQRSTTGHSPLNVSRQSAQMGSPRRSQATSRPGRSNEGHARATARCDVETKLRGLTDRMEELAGPATPAALPTCVSPAASLSAALPCLPEKQVECGSSAQRLHFAIVCARRYRSRGQHWHLARGERSSMRRHRRSREDDGCRLASHASQQRRQETGLLRRAAVGAATIAVAARTRSKEGGPD